MALTKQAKILSPHQINAVLRHLDGTRYPARSRLMFCLSAYAGLRAAEISAMQWSMVCDAELQLLDHIALDNAAAKGQRGGRSIPMNKTLRDALTVYWQQVRPRSADLYLFRSERGGGMSAKVVTNWFRRVYGDLGYEGCSSHSGRRTFVTTLAKNIARASGSLEDVRRLAGHSSISTTQRYIEHDRDAARKAVELL